MSAKNKKTNSSGRDSLESKVMIENAGIVVEQKITETLEKNYMPYAMSVILSRAIPEIDGFKPSHRKLLYTMYKMGLLTGKRTKSANIVGQTMRLNPHGDGPIYDTMVRLSRGNEALLHPYIDSKGNFGKSYSRDMAYAAYRYTEAKLSEIAKELFAEIDLNTVDFVDNYDSTTKEPTLLPVTFPSILVNANMGIAVGMASSVCPFNLKEVCDTTISLMKNPDHDVSETLIAPDFPGGGYIVYDKKILENIYKTGRGGFKVRGRYTFDKIGNCIDITQIPPSTTVEAIIDKIVDLVRNNKLREVVDVRDETDLGGLKITIDLRKGANEEDVIRKLYQLTPLEDTFSCNFNILVHGAPRVMGVSEILTEWISFRQSSVKRRIKHLLEKQKAKLHLLEGLQKILLDIDKAIKIVRETEEEKEVVPNLMIGFGIDEIQADFVSEIKLRQLNRENIIKRLKEIEGLEEDIADKENILETPNLVDKVIINELKEISKTYEKPRLSLLYYPTESDSLPIEEEIPDYPVHLFFTAGGYFKKIVPQSLRMSGEQKLKDGDKIVQEFESSNSAELLFFTNKHVVYKANAYDFEDTKASVMGSYLPAVMEMDPGEEILYLVVTDSKYDGFMIFIFDDGRVAKVALEGYKTITKRRKLVSAYNDKLKLVKMFYIKEDKDFLLRANNNRTLIFGSGALSAKSSKNTQGVKVMSLKKNTFIEEAYEYRADMVENDHRFRTKNLPAAGSFPRPEDEGEQLSLIK